MNVTAKALEGPRGGGDPRDGGTTMIEVVVSMVVMSIAMTIFTTAVMTIYRVVAKTESLSTTQGQVTTAFQRMDRDLRYASAISEPNVPAPGADFYVEYLMTNAGTDACVQLRLATSAQRLERRTWPKGGTPPPGGWVLLVAPVAPPASGTVAPFQFFAASGTTHYQSLRVNVTITAGTGSTATTRETKVTFAALNTTVATLSSAVCTEGRSIP